MNFEWNSFQAKLWHFSLRPYTFSRHIWNSLQLFFKYWKWTFIPKPANQLINTKEKKTHSDKTCPNFSLLELTSITIPGFKANSNIYPFLIHAKIVTNSSHAESWHKLDFLIVYLKFNFCLNFFDCLTKLTIRDKNNKQ